MLKHQALLTADEFEKIVRWVPILIDKFQSEQVLPFDEHENFIPKYDIPMMTPPNEIAWPNRPGHFPPRLRTTTLSIASLDKADSNNLSDVSDDENHDGNENAIGNEHEQEHEHQHENSNVGENNINNKNINNINTHNENINNQNNNDDDDNDDIEILAYLQPSTSK